MTWPERYRPRTYRVVKFVIDARSAWVVVSESLRNDDTWDVIGHFTTRQAAFAYVDEVTERNSRIARWTGCGKQVASRGQGSTNPQAVSRTIDA